MKWTGAVYWVCWFWVVREVQATWVVPGTTLQELQAICRWLLLVLGVQVPRRGQAVNRGRLLLVPALGPLSERDGAQ